MNSPLQGRDPTTLQEICSVWANRVAPKTEALMRMTTEASVRPLSIMEVDLAEQVAGQLWAELRVLKASLLTGTHLDRSSLTLLSQQSMTLAKLQQQQQQFEQVRAQVQDQIPQVFKAETRNSDPENEYSWHRVVPQNQGYSTPMHRTSHLAPRSQMESSLLDYVPQECDDSIKPPSQNSNKAYEAAMQFLQQYAGSLDPVQLSQLLEMVGYQTGEVEATPATPTRNLQNNPQYSWQYTLPPLNDQVLNQLERRKRGKEEDSAGVPTRTSLDSAYKKKRPRTVSHRISQVEPPSQSLNLSSPPSSTSCTSTSTSPNPEEPPLITTQCSSVNHRTHTPFLMEKSHQDDAH
ncbi:hypothetical protein Pelo_10793 [Pelomyxa schiedti]|nr:hypothetical protein Pelo_10793 [Pelomyxa schiedti]